MMERRNGAYGLKQEYAVYATDKIGSARPSRIVFGWQKVKDCSSLEEVMEILKPYFSNPQNILQRVKNKRNSLTLAFESLPQWGNHEELKWRKYDQGMDWRHYFYVKIKFNLSLEKLL